MVPYGNWGTVCDGFFRRIDATVACGQLGCSRGETCEPGPGSGPIHPNNEVCAGTERRLIHCPRYDAPKVATPGTSGLSLPQRGRDGADQTAYIREASHVGLPLVPTPN